VSGLVVSVSRVGDAGAACAVVRLAGEADVTTHALGEALRAEAANRPALLLVEMSGLRFIDSSALNAILRVHEDLLATGCELALVGPSGSVARVEQPAGEEHSAPAGSNLARMALPKRDLLRPRDYPARVDRPGNEAE
jgi:anti-anti-sigma factor